MNPLLKISLDGGAQRIMILGVGNPLRGDDGIGPFLIQRLQGKTKCALLDCAEVPENYAHQVLAFHPDLLLIVDAADWNGQPGEIRQIGEEEIANASFSTHDLSLRLFLKFIRAHLRPKIILLGVQSGRRGFMDRMSPEVKEAAVLLEDFICTLPCSGGSEGSSW